MSSYEFDEFYDDSGDIDKVNSFFEDTPKLPAKAAAQTTYRAPRVAMMGMPDAELRRSPKKSKDKVEQASLRQNSAVKSPGMPSIKPRKKAPMNNNAMAMFEEIAKLNSTVDVFRNKVLSYEGELKTLRIVNRRQELAIQRMDKDQGDLPKVVQQLTQELTGLKKAHQGCFTRIANAERSSSAHIEQTLKLQDQVLKLNSVLRSKNLDDFERLQKACDRLKEEVLHKDAEIEDLSRKLKHAEAERAREVKELRSRVAKLTKGLHEMHLPSHNAPESTSVLSFYSTGGSAAVTSTGRSHKENFIELRQVAESPIRVQEEHSSHAPKNAIRGESVDHTSVASSHPPPITAAQEAPKKPSFVFKPPAIAKNSDPAKEAPYGQEGAQTIDIQESAQYNRLNESVPLTKYDSSDNDYKSPTLGDTSNDDKSPKISDDNHSGSINLDAAFSPKKEETTARPPIFNDTEPVKRPFAQGIDSYKPSFLSDITSTNKIVPNATVQNTTEQVKPPTNIGSQESLVTGKRPIFLEERTTVLNPVTAEDSSQKKTTYRPSFLSDDSQNTKPSVQDTAISSSNSNYKPSFLESNEQQQKRRLNLDSPKAKDAEIDIPLSDVEKNSKQPPQQLEEDYEEDFDVEEEIPE